jgi:DNA repair exonuclease SbcCD ATPase subunit
MILRQVKLSGWRSFSDSKTVGFEPGFNLIVGPNEAGKSTLFEALARGLFDSARGKREELKQLQPVGTGLAPRVEVEFTAAGSEFRVVKQFLRDEICELWEQLDGSWRRRADGDAAELAIREFASGGERGTSRALTPSLRGVAEALWHLQTDKDDLPKEWTTAIHRGLGGLIEVAVESKPVFLYLKKLEQHYSEYFTEKGRPKVDGPVLGIDAEVARQQKTVDELRSKQSKAQDIREQLSEISDDLRRNTIALEGSIDTLGSCEAGVEEADRFERGLEALQAECNQQVAYSSSISAKWNGLLAREKTDDQLRAKISEATLATLVDRAELANVEMQISDLVAERTAATTIEAVQEKRAAGLRAASSVRRLRADRDRFDAHLKRVEQKQADLSAKQVALVDLRAPEQKEHSEFLRLSKELDQMRLEAELAAIRVRFNLSGQVEPISAEPEAGVSDGEFVITRETTFSIVNVGQITVRGGGRSLDELNSGIERTQASLRDLRERFQLSEDEEFEPRFRSGEELRKSIFALQNEVNDMALEVPKAEEELRKTNIGILEEEARAVNVAEEVGDQGGASIRRLEDEADRLTKEAKQQRLAAESQLEERRSRSTLLKEQVNQKELEKRDWERDLKWNEAQNAQTIREFGSREALEVAAGDAAREVERLGNELEARKQKVELSVVLPRMALDRARNEVNRLRDLVQEMKQDLRGKEGELKNLVGDGFYETLCAAEENLEALLIRQKVLMIRAEALKLLRSMVKERQSKQSDELVKPITETLKPWLTYVTSGKYDDVSIGTTLIPQSLHSPTTGGRFDLELLSCGMREQLVILTRLALARIISKKNPFPIILDDRLVNSDPHRRKRMIEVLMSVAQDTQVVIATCNEELYAGMEGNRISLQKQIPSHG